MYVRWFAPLLIAAFASPLHAQSNAVLSGRPEADAAFARKLFERGMPELAEQVCVLLERSGKLTGSAEKAVASLHIDLRAALATKSTDLAKRKDLLTQVLREKEDFIKQHQGTPEAEEAALTLPDVYADLGDTLKSLIESEKQPQVVADYQAEGQKIYAEAEERLKLRIEELTKLVIEKEDKGEEDLKLVEQLMTVRFNLPRTLFGHALMYPKDEFRRKSLLEEAAKQLQIFGLDFTQEVITKYDAQILEGRCHKELGDYELALTVWGDMCQSLMDGYEVVKGVVQIEPAACRIVAIGLLQRALLFTELKRFQEGVADAKNFFATAAGAYDSDAGLALLYQMGEMQIEAGDSEGADKTGNKLVELDGNGPWGNNGRLLIDKALGKSGGTVSSDKLLALARAQAKRDEMRALALCRQAAANAKVDKSMDKTGFEALLLMGDIFRGRRWYHEAMLAYDEASTRYPAADDAAEAVYLSLQCLQTINDGQPGVFAGEKRPYYKRRIEEKLKTLATRYANHSRASYALIIEGRSYDADEDYLKAAETYQKVQPAAQSYAEAQVSAAFSYFLHARKLAKDPAKKAEAKPFFEQAMGMLRKTGADVEKKLDETFDLVAQQRMVGLAFRARITLAQIQLDDAVNAPVDALATLEGLDENKRFNSDADNVAKVWNLKIQAFNKQGKIEEATKALDGLVTKSPDSPAISTAAGAVAREYDERAVQAQDKGDKKAALDLWKRASKYYRMSAQAMLKGTSARGNEVTRVAERLYTLGLIGNDVEGDSFLGWKAPRGADLDNWRSAADLYEAALRQAPSRKGRLYEARAHGFLGDWERSADSYARFFEEITLVDPGTGKFATATLQDPDLQKLGVVTAYIEWGVAESNAGKATQDTEHTAKSLGIFANVAKNPNSVVIDSKPWWIFKYAQIQALVTKGDFKEAGIQLRDAERSTPALGKPAGLESEFKKLKSDIEKQSFTK